MENASLYSSANALQRNDASRVLNELVPHLPFTNNHTQRVLDIGCGSGDVTAEILLPLLPQGVKQIIGVDKSEKMVEHASKLFGTSRLSFFPMDIEERTEIMLKKIHQKMINLENNVTSRKSRSTTIDLLINDLQLEDNPEKTLVGNSESPLTKDIINNNCNSNKVTSNQHEKFDFVFSIYCLHWIKNQRQALTNIYSLMKYRGEAVLIILAESDIFTLYRRLAKIEPWSSFMQDVNKFISPYHDAENPAGMLSDHASSVGFQVVSAVCQQRTFVYRNYQALRDAIKAVNPFYSRMSQLDGEKFLNECISVVKANNLADTVNDQVVVRYSIVVARLRK